MRCRRRSVSWTSCWSRCTEDWWACLDSTQGTRDQRSPGPPARQPDTGVAPPRNCARQFLRRHALASCRLTRRLRANVSGCGTVLLPWVCRRRSRSRRSRLVGRPAPGLSERRRGCVLRRRRRAVVDEARGGDRRADTLVDDLDDLQVPVAVLAPHVDAVSRRHGGRRLRHHTVHSHVTGPAPCGRCASARSEPHGPEPAVDPRGVDPVIVARLPGLGGRPPNSGSLPHQGRPGSSLLDPAGHAGVMAALQRPGVRSAGRCTGSREGRTGCTHELTAEGRE